MDKFIFEFSEEIRRDLVQSWEQGRLRSLTDTIKRRLGDLKAKQLTFNLTFEVTFYSTERLGKSHLPVTRFPLASLGTLIGLSKSVSEELLNLNEVTNDEQAKSDALELFRRGTRKATYSVGFGATPSFANRLIRICSECKGAGISVK